MTDFERLVDHIYGAATEPDQWPSVLYELNKVVETAGASLLVRRSDHWVGWRRAGSVAVDADFVDAYMSSEAAARSETTARLVACKHNGFVAEHELFSDEEYRADTYFTDWCAPNGFHHCAATCVKAPSGDLVVVHLERRAGEPEFSRAELNRLDRFRPHLARAGLLTARWRLERLRAASEALALIGLPAAVLDPGGRVLAANGLIQAMAGHVVWLQGGLVALQDQAATALLRGALARAGDPTWGAVRSFPARSAVADGAVIAHVVPIMGASRDLFEGGVSLLVITPVSATTAPDLALIQGLFDLTPSEAVVAWAIREGLTIDQIAARQAVSRETIRTQLKGVLAKTGAQRQSEVAALLAGMTRLPLATPARRRH